MDKFLIQPTKFNYYSSYEEWLEHNNVPASVLEAYEATRQNLLYTMEEKNFLKLVLSVLLEAPHSPGDTFCLVLCKDNKGHVFLLNKHEVKPFFKVSRFWWLYKGTCSELVFGVDTFFETEEVLMTYKGYHERHSFWFRATILHGLKEHLLKRRFWLWRLN